MATILSVSMGRPDHYWFVPLYKGVSTVHAARCECGATWCEHDPANTAEYETFCQWAVAHETTS